MMPNRFNILSWLALSCAVLMLACGGGYAPKKASNSPRYAAPSHSGGGSSVHRGGSDDSASWAESEAPASSGVRTAATSPAPRSYSDSGATQGKTIAQERRERPGLGTRFGERRSSDVVQRRFVRAAQRPFANLAIHYNNLAGIQQQSAYRGTSLSELRARTQGGGISISLLDEAGRLLHGGTGAGRTYVVGRDNQRYTIQIRNDSGGRFEVVSSVDGLDVVDGLPANYSKRGYIIAPYSTLEIEGFRTSMESVAAFRFGAVKDSYAAKTSGDRNVGVIGFAFFAERGSQWTSDEIRRRETANPFPGGFAAPPAVVR